MAERVIELVDAGKTYRSGDIAFEALRGIDLRIDDGEFVAVIGPSGSGKSTVMNVLGCLDTLTRGTYLLEGQDTRDLDEAELAGIRNRSIGFVFSSSTCSHHCRRCRTSNCR